METVKMILRVVSVIVGIGAYLAGWKVYVKMVFKDKILSDAGAVFYGLWTVAHVIAAIIGFTWAWT